MGLVSFFGGVHVKEYKDITKDLSIIDFPEAKSLFISMSQHIGAPAKAIVKPNQIVKKGELIGEASGFISANIHSSVSGKVKRIHTLSILGRDTQVIEIENDFNEEWHEDISAKDYESLSSDEIIDFIRESGIVGMGGAGFPLHAKLKVPSDIKIDTLLINAAECEPYLTNDHRLMLEETKDIVNGIKIMIKALSIDKAIIGIEDNKPDAIEKLKKEVENISEIEVMELKTKYPQGAEKQLIYACTKRVVGSGQLPMNVGCVVNNVATAKAVSDLFTTGSPLIERICTVTGSAINKPMNIRFKIGTKINDIIEYAGGLKDEFKKLVLGGPMMGIASPSLDYPTTKTTSGLLFMNKRESKEIEMSACIKCAKCVEVCPMFLQPIYLSKYVLLDLMEKSFDYSPMDCIECGSCSFICPASRPLLETIRISKHAFRARKV